MSVSSHLTPEPERRLWILLQSMQTEGDRADRRTATLAALALAELVYLKVWSSAGAVLGLSLVVLGLSLPLAAFSFASIARLPDWLAFLDKQPEKPSGADRLFVSEDVAKYSHGELINKLDRYFGGGITATQYYEDIVGEALVHARIAVRKRRLGAWQLWLVGLGQVLLLAAWLSPRS